MMVVNPTTRAAVDARVRADRSRGFTMVEVIAVIGILVVLVALLLPALFGARASGVRAESMANLRQVANWMQLYSQDNKTHILPSRFNYAGSPYPVKVRKNTSNVGYNQFQGTWTDILWTLYADTSFPSAESVPPGNHQYQYDSPDDVLYDNVPGISGNALRSARENSRGNRSVPGYFAANDFFNADQSTPDFNGWYTTSQIEKPDSSLYIIDSWAGEVIADDPAAYDYASGGGSYEVDFRYEGEALIMFMDGSVRGESFFEDLPELESRGVRVLNVDRR